MTKRTFCTIMRAYRNNNNIERCEKWNNIEAALKKGAKPNLPYNHQGWTPFLRACRAFYEPEVIKLFLEHGANINSKNKDGETPLHIMAQHRSSYDCMELLIAEGAKVDAQDNDGWTPLMNAVHHPQAMMRKDVIYGLAENSDTSIKNNDGKTAYDIAKENAAFSSMLNLQNILTF